MKEMFFYLKVILFSIALFAFGWITYHNVGLHVGLEGIETPTFIALMTFYFYLVHSPLKYHEPFVKPFKGFDPNIKVLSFNPAPLLYVYFCYGAILSACKEVNLGTFLSLAFAFLFFKACNNRGFSPVQSWYETPEGKFLRVVRI